MTDGKMWMRDFFVHDGELKLSYGDYLLSSFSPFASPGVHIILDAPTDSMSAAYFSRESEKLAARLHDAFIREAERKG